MPVISRLILVQPHGDECESLRYAFERDGTEVTELPADDGLTPFAALMATQDPDSTTRAFNVVLTTAPDDEDSSVWTSELSDLIDASPRKIPILYLAADTDNCEQNTQALMAAGASMVLYRPLFLRDVVVTAGLLARRRRAELMRGDLRDFDSLFYLVRGLTQLKRSCVLTAVRGLRRGEIRFFEGDVTSSQVGMLHGLSALHHMTLWQMGTFELRLESVVKRQQIPMDTAELMSDLHRFLAEVEEAAGSLRFHGAYKSIDDKAHTAHLPDAIAKVFDLMDGTRTLPDVVEDSPYRMFETLRIVHRFLEHDLIEHVAEIASGFGFKLRRRVEPMVLSDGAPLADADIDEETGKSKTTNKPATSDSDRANAIAPEDWADVMPSSPSVEDKLAQVVPAAVAAGEIVVSRRAPPSVDDASGDRPATAQNTSTEVAAKVAVETSKLVSENREPATADSAFSDDEEAFFRDETQRKDTPSSPTAALDEIDDAYEPVSFWQRLLGRGRRRRGKIATATSSAMTPRRERHTTEKSPEQPPSAATAGKPDKPDSGKPDSGKPASGS